MKYAREIGFGVVVVVLGALLFAWLTSDTRGTDPGPVEAARAPAEDRGRPPAAATPEPEPLAVAEPPRPSPHQAMSSIEVPPERIPRSVRPFSSADEASAFVEGRVVAVLSAVDPTLDVTHLERECSSDGRICTFYGEWPGDDFVKRWLQAIAGGKTGIEMLEGVRFSVFKPIEEGGEKRLMLTAHAP